MKTNRLYLAGLTSLLALSAACGGSVPPSASPAAESAPTPPPPAGAAATAAAEEAAPAEPAAPGATRPAPARDGATGGEVAKRASTPSGAVVMAPSGVKAGEWDDNANYREFQKWLGSSGGMGHHKVDVSGRQFLVVRDAAGKGVPRCAISVTDEAQHGVALTTTASGRSILFPRAEGLGNSLTATARCLGVEKSVKFSAANADGVIDLQLAAHRPTPSREVDLGFVLDTTGSMSEEIVAVKATIQKVASVLGAEGVKVKMGLVEYKDRTDPFVTRVYPMTSDLGAFARQVEGLSASGGGDYPESMNEGLHVALNKLAWGDASVVKMAMLVGDAPPHLDYAQDFDYAADMKDAAHRGIQVFTVAASGMDPLGQIVWRQIAQYTDATNLFVMRGGAGPQSTGGGDPLSSCGGTQTAFRSGNLDQLIVERVRRALKTLDADPMRIPGVGRDENAKPCNERIQVAAG